jgi:hypothetical protein
MKNNFEISAANPFCEISSMGRLEANAKTKVGDFNIYDFE